MPLGPPAFQYSTAHSVWFATAYQEPYIGWLKDALFGFALKPARLVSTSGALDVESSARSACQLVETGSTKLTPWILPRRVLRRSV